MEVDEIDLAKSAEGTPQPKHKQDAANKDAALATSKAILQGKGAVDESVLTLSLPDGHFAKEMQGMINSALAGAVAEGQAADEVAAMRRMGAQLLMQGLERETHKRASKASTRISHLTKLVATQGNGFEKSPSKLLQASRLLSDPMPADGAEGVRKDLSALFGQAQAKLAGTAASGDDTSLADVLLHFYNSKGGGMFMPKKQKGVPGKVLAASINHAAQKHLQMVHAACARGDHELAVELLLSMRDFDKEVGELNSVAQAVGVNTANSLYLSRGKLHGVTNEQWELIAKLADNKDFKEVFTQVALPEPKAKRSRPTADAASDSESDSDASANKKPRRTQTSVCPFCNKPGHTMQKCWGFINTVKGMTINGGGNSNNKQQKQKANNS